MSFKKGDKVKIARDSLYYGINDSVTNPSEVDGVVWEVRPNNVNQYVVLWPGNWTNSYKLFDLVRA